MSSSAHSQFFQPKGINKMPSITYLAAGCFWGVEELLRSVPGVLEIEAGYTGGSTENPTYEMVCSETTGHAEAVKVYYDSSTVQFSELLTAFFRLHDPTTKNRQGNDRGTRYRSAIFVQNDAERAIAEEIIKAVDASKKWPQPIVTTIEPFTHWWPAEEYHQDYLLKHPKGYNCHYWRS
jgi:peptide-methionine (S)-S-oxide reductase